jgi:hemolysin III
MRGAMGRNGAMVRGHDDEETLGEEIANAATHGVAAALAIAGLVVLVVGASGEGSALQVVSLAVYGATLVILYGASALYHAVQGPRTKAALHLLDHAAIFLLIAGTYTPFALVSLGGAWGWSLFVAVWTLALAGILFRLLRRRHDPKVTVALYLALGWIGLVAAGELWSAVEPAGLAWLLAGGLAYSGGVAFYAWRRLRFNHALWHLCVIAGSACHFTAIAGWVAPAT